MRDTEKHNKPRVTVTLEPDILEWANSEKGLASLSAYINDSLKKQRALGKPALPPQDVRNAQESGSVSTSTLKAAEPAGKYTHKARL